MSRISLMTGLRTMALVGSFAALVATIGGCGVEVGADYPEPGYGECLSDAYVATSEPVYYEVRASYWCGGVWYYRDGLAWGHYNGEPPFLYQARMRGMPGRHVYEPGWGRGGGRPRGGRGGGGRGGGGRGGGGGGRR